ncbi:hypothetical protein DRQ36_05325 [bacterium]|nr:MAG: hypothetical protein DRQ36_05325 [bacterium]
MELFKLGGESIEKFDKADYAEFDESKIEEILLDAELEPIAGRKLLCIGNQITTSTDKRLDILAIDPEGRLVVAELKRGMAPREVIAQIVDYASWLDSLAERDFEQIAKGKLGKRLYEAFKDYYGKDLDSIGDDVILYLVARDFPEEVINASNFLSERGVSIICVSFDLFKCDDQLYLVTRNVSGDTETIEGKQDGKISPYKRDDRKFSMMLKKRMEEEFGDWLDDLGLVKRDNFRLYQARDGYWTAAYSDCKSDKYTLTIEASIGRNIEKPDEDGYWVWFHCRRKREVLIFAELIKREDIIEQIKETGMKIDFEEDPEWPEINIKLEDWADEDGNIKDDFADTVIEQFERAKPLIKALLTE